MAEPRISVIVPTWNSAAYLRETITSILAQTWSDVEIIVADDGSTDGTARLLAEFAPRIRVVTGHRGGRPSIPRNNGLRQATGDFIALCDSDDIMDPDKLAVCMEVFAEHPGVDIVCTNFRGIDEHGKVIRENWLRGYRRFRRDLRPSPLDRVGLLGGDAAYGHLLHANFIGTSSVVCRREMFERVGIFDENLANSDDIDLWRRAARAGCVLAFVDRTLHAYRVRPGSITSQGGSRIPARIEAYRMQLARCRGPADVAVINRRIGELQIGLGWHLRRSGRYEESVAAYREGLAQRFSLLGWVGLQRARMLKGLRSGRRSSRSAAATRTSPMKS